MGHSSPATTLRFYARWVPSGDQRWVEILSQSEGPAGAVLEPESGTQTGAAAEAAANPAKDCGEPWRSRTSNLLIKSQLLCQLS